MSDTPATGLPDDRLLFDRLYRRVHDRLLARVTSLVRDRNKAEDITATAFQIAWQKRAQFRGDASLATWVYAISLQAVRESWRRQRSTREQSLEQSDRTFAAEPDRVSDRLERDDLREKLAQALEQVPRGYRRLLIERIVNGQSNRDLARRRDVPIGTIGSRLSTAKRLLKESWQATAVPHLERNVADATAQQIAQEALKRLTQELQAGRSEALQSYLAAMGRFHRYSWNNVLLIQAQRPDATRVAGYHTWHDLGRSVRRGEKGIRILAPVRTKRDAAELALEDRRADALRVAGFRTAYVFDVAQTEGKPLPAFAVASGDPRDHIDKLKAVVASQGIALQYDAAIAPAQGLSSGGRIQLLPNLPPAEEFSTLAHELAHEMLHHRGDARLSKTVRETQAEAVAFVVSHGIGLDSHRAAADYIALYNGDEKTLAESLATIQSTAARILKELLPAERSLMQESDASARALTPAETMDDRKEAGPAEAPSPIHSPEVPQWDR